MVNLQAEDGLLHFQWYQRTGPTATVDAAEHDVIVFPGEANIIKVSAPSLDPPALLAFAMILSSCYCSLTEV